MNHSRNYIFYLCEIALSSGYSNESDFKGEETAVWRDIIKHSADEQTLGHMIRNSILDVI